MLAEAGVVGIVEQIGRHSFEAMMTTLQAACDEVPEKTPQMIEGPQVAGVEAFSSSSLVLRIIAKTEAMEQWRTERILRKRMKEVLDIEKEPESSSSGSFSVLNEHAALLLDKFLQWSFLTL